MALSFDDRLLGEKVDNYCSSGDEREDSDDDYSSCTSQDKPVEQTIQSNGHKPSQTGPKGVMEDYKRYKKLQFEQQREKDILFSKLATACTLTCRPYSEDVKAQTEEQKLQEVLDLEEDEEFLKEYRRKRLAEMNASLENMPRFEKIYQLDATNFVHEIDKEAPNITVLVHIYEEGVSACKCTNECIEVLCKTYPHVKFCKLRAGAACMSRNFAVNGVPAIIVYKKGELIGNLISINKELDNEFSPDELENYLYEHGFLPPRNESANTGGCLPQSSSIRCASLNSDDSE